MSTLDATLAAIDAATEPACAVCTGPLYGSPSDDYCGPDCQEAWNRARSVALERYVDPLHTWATLGPEPWEFDPASAGPIRLAEPVGILNARGMRLFEWSAEGPRPFSDERVVTMTFQVDAAALLAGLTHTFAAAGQAFLSFQRGRTGIRTALLAFDEAFHAPEVPSVDLDGIVRRHLKACDDCRARSESGVEGVTCVEQHAARLGLHMLDPIIAGDLAPRPNPHRWRCPVDLRALATEQREDSLSPVLPEPTPHVVQTATTGPPPRRRRDYARHVPPHRRTTGAR